MKKRTKVLILIRMLTINTYEEVEVEEFNDLFWFYSCKWKNNKWLKEKYYVYDYALVDKKTGLHVALGDSLKEITQDYEKLIENYNKSIKKDNISAYYLHFVDKYNKVLKERNKR